jgi:hypothetical protein
LALCDGYLFKNPNDHKHWLTRAVLALRQRGLPEDWAGYEHRPSFMRQARPNDDLPRWQGQPVPSKKVLIFAEQGIGDQIYFAKALQCLPAGDFTLAINSGVGQLIADQFQLPRVDFQPIYEEAIDVVAQYDYFAPIGDLPQVFGYSPAKAVPGQAYLTAPADRVAHWQSLLAEFTGLKVGLCWAGNPDYKSDEYRSLRLAQLAPLVDVPNANYFSLQLGLPEREMLFAPGGLRVLNLATDLNDMSETAAVIAALDVLITVDTALAHLAGALGKPVWMLSRRIGDWRWGLDGEQCDWYPSMRIFRQEHQGCWAPVIEDVKQALLELTDLHTQQGG